MAWGDAVIVAPESIADIAQKPIGTGAFRFVELGAGRPDRRWRRTPTTGARRRKLDQRDLPLHLRPDRRLRGDDGRAISTPSPAIPAPENLPQFEADPRFQVIVGNTEGETILAMNNAQPPLDNVQGARGDRPCHRPAGDHRRRDVRLRHADRRAFRAAQPGLCRPDRAVGLRPREVEGAAGRGRGREPERCR